MCVTSMSGANSTATGGGVRSQIAATDPVPPFVVVDTPELFIMRGLYERGTRPHNI